MPDAGNPLGRGSQTGRPLLSAVIGVGALAAGVIYPLTSGEPRTDFLLIAWATGLVLGSALALLRGILAAILLIAVFITGQLVARTFLGDEGYASPAGLFMLGSAGLIFAAQDVLSRRSTRSA